MYDILLASMVFIIVFGLSAITFTSVLGNLESEQAEFRLHTTAAGVADALVLTQGSPGNWEAQEDFNRVGLVTEKRILSVDKIHAFSATGYDTLKQKMGITEYDFSLDIQSGGNIIVDVSPITPTEHAIKISIHRIVEYNGEMAAFTFTLFR
jgi:hypothetical protein